MAEQVGRLRVRLPKFMVGHTVKPGIRISLCTCPLFVAVFNFNLLNGRASAPKIYLNPSFYLRAIFFGLSAEDKEKLDQTQSFMKQGSGYSTQQATKPQTLGYALADSPVGLLAWIFEKLVNWTDDYPWDDDEGRFNVSSMHRYLNL